MESTADNNTFENGRGQKLHWKCWTRNYATRQAAKPRALVFIVHGLGEHCGWYAPVAEPLAQLGMIVYGHDHVGHGRSEGDRAYIKDYKHYVDDLLQHIDLRRKDHPDCPVFIIAHSMGGCISILAALARPDLLSGLVLIGPLVTPSADTAVPWKVFLAKLIAWVWPQCPVEPLNPDWICKDKTVVERYKADPLNYHSGIKAGFGVATLKALESMQSELHKVVCPLLIFHGDEDKLCEIAGSKILHTLSTSKDKTLKVIEGAYHQIHNEPNGVGEKAIQDINKWISTRIGDKDAK